MIFLDTHSLKTHFNLNKEIDELENQKENISKTIEEDNASIKKLQNVKLSSESAFIPQVLPNL